MVRIENLKCRECSDRRRGLSMIEVMIAIAILSLGILGMTVMQLDALRQGGAGRHTTDAAAVGRTYLEQVPVSPSRMPTGT
jgi:prepilin-type N-terminal cleavage/methylation domain-containing protein